MQYWSMVESLDDGHALERAFERGSGIWAFVSHMFNATSEFLDIRLRAHQW